MFFELSILPLVQKLDLQKIEFDMKYQEKRRQFSTCYTYGERIFPSLHLTQQFTFAECTTGVGESKLSCTIKSLCSSHSLRGRGIVGPRFVRATQIVKINAKSKKKKKNK